MKAFVANMEKMTLENTDYRRVVFTSHYTQLVLMSLQPGDQIHNEIHGLDQFIRVEQGEAKVILDNGNEEQLLKENWAIIVPAGTWHQVVNVGEGELKLYTLYSPPAHVKDTVQPTLADEKEDQFNGITSLDSAS